MDMDNVKLLPEKDRNNQRSAIVKATPCMLSSI